MAAEAIIEKRKYSQSNFKDFDVSNAVVPRGSKDGLKHSEAPDVEGLRRCIRNFDVTRGRIRFFIVGAVIFDRVEWTEGRTGCPILAESVSMFECRLQQSTPVATHCIFVPSVVGFRSGRGLPLLYSDRAFRGLADAEQQA